MTCVSINPPPSRSPCADPQGEHLQPADAAGTVGDVDGSGQRGFHAGLAPAGARPPMDAGSATMRSAMQSAAATPARAR